MVRNAVTMQHREVFEMHFASTSTVKCKKKRKKSLSSVSLCVVELQFLKCSDRKWSPDCLCGLSPPQVSGVELCRNRLAVRGEIRLLLSSMSPRHNNETFFSTPILYPFLRVYAISLSVSQFCLVLFPCIVFYKLDSLESQGNITQTHTFQYHQFNRRVPC